MGVGSRLGKLRLVSRALLLGGLFSFSSVALCQVEADASPDASVIRFSTATITPYQTLDDKGELSGFAIPIIECLMQAMSLEYRIEVLPWARAQKNVELGHSDAFFVASRNADRDRYATQSKPLFSGTRSWYVRPSISLKPDTIQFREQALVGTIFGTNMHRLLQEEFANVVTKTTEEELIVLLDKGRLDAVLMTDLMFETSLAQMDMSEHSFRRYQSAQKPLGVYFGHHFLARQADFLARFNEHVPGCL